MKALALFLLTATALAADPVSLFDGKTLDGWSAREGEEKWWRVQDGALTGGSLEERVPRNTFLVSDRSFENFELSYQLRLVQGEGFQNSGLQIRSIRKPGGHEMIGYQVDAGIGYWGDLYDESRRAKLAGPVDPEALKAVVHDWDWNQFRVLCEGPRIRAWINDVLVTDFTEKDNAIPRDGIFGLQAHGGGKFLIQMKDVLITELPPTPNAATWEKPDPDGPREPEEQKQSFILPDGFTAELVASEAEGLNKPITVSWDRHGRMWSMTAVEYPIDANEDREAAEALFAAGGRDRLLVFDEPNQPTIQTPRTFAEGLALPLGVLPMKDGVLAQYGTEIRRYIDDDGDGTANRHETVLTGFGIEDSHLFPHQFERPPGGWIYVAQGAFNRSDVRRPDGSPFASGEKSVTFNNCKLARFKPDGSRFENLTGGPNNIWGLAISRLGETFIQEANDMGYPVAEFVPGKHYPTPFGPRMKEDAPILPRSTQGNQMGGTGLSGLAIAEDADSPFANDPQGRQLFYLANPITNRIQTVSLARDANGHPIYEKGADFLLTDDTWFRPVAIHFGPDGCLYIVDWYNKIISHNEIPRTHPDRDKSRGRIWRIRHQSQSAPPRIDLASLADDELLPLLGGPNARLSMMAWNEIGDRQATTLVPELNKLATSTDTPLPRRTAALWALEVLGAITIDTLLPAIQSPEPTLRYEALRIAGETSLPETDIMRLLGHVAGDTHFRVRTAIIQLMRDHQAPTTAMLAAAAVSIIQPPLSNNSRGSYDREFERYLVRWLFSGHPEATRQILASQILPLEAALVAARSFEETTEAARLFTAKLQHLQRPLLPAEITLLGQHLDQPEILETLKSLLADPAASPVLLRAMTQLAPETAARPGFATLIGDACARLMADDPTTENARLTIDLARRFRIAALADVVRPWTLDEARTPAEIATGLAALREMAAIQPADCLPFLDHPADAVRREAVLALSSIDDTSIISTIAGRWPTMPAALRSLAVDGMVATAPKAEALATAIADGGFPDIDTASIEKILATLGPENPTATRMLGSMEGSIKRLIRLTGKPGDHVRNAIDLTGPFTVETWIKLDPGIDNADGILGRKGGLDINFHNSTLHVYGGPEIGNLIVASRRVEADTWIHCAIVRDSDGRFTLYFDGEPDPATGAASTADFTGLKLGETTPQQGTAAHFDEFRVWNTARSAADIRAHHRVAFEDGEKPEGLVHRITATTPDLTLDGTAAIVPSADFPELQTPEQQRAAEARFQHFRALANQTGDASRGKILAQASCLICHQVQDEGIAIGPDLSGAGAMGIDSLLRNILTPNEMLESGYYRHDIRLTDGTFTSGFLAAETQETLTLRRIGADDLVIPRTTIASHQIAKRSLMPEGLIDGYSKDQVRDLFTYLLSLK